MVRDGQGVTPTWEDHSGFLMGRTCFCQTHSWPVNVWKTKEPRCGRNNLFLPTGEMPWNQKNIVRCWWGVPPLADHHKDRFKLLSKKKWGTNDLASVFSKYLTLPSSASNWQFWTYTRSWINQKDLSWTKKKVLEETTNLSIWFPAFFHKRSQAS